jgi:hypothetical protein
MKGMETFTIRDAAERCDVTYQSLRKRVDRGTVRTVKGADGVRRVPRAELERAGLWPGSQLAAPTGQELEQLRAELEATRAELAATTETLTRQADAERQAREIAEAAMHEHRVSAELAEAEREAAEHARIAAAAQLEGLTTGGLLSSVRRLRVLRANGVEQPTES